MANRMSENELMASAKISTAVATMAIPSVISSLVTVAYNLADTFFVGQTGDPLQVAAVSLTNPIFIFFMAFANVLGMGGSAFVSMALGEENGEKVRQTSSFVTWVSFSIGLVTMFVLLFFTRPVLTLFGADSTTYVMARSYTVYIAIGAPFIIWSVVASFIVRGEGASKEAMIGSMIGTVSNIILDPIFISVFGMGAGGAAIATTIGNCLAALYYLYYFLRKSHSMSIHPKYFPLQNRLGLRIIKTGLPTGLFSLLMSISTIILNQILVPYGNEAVAAIGIVFKANMFITFFQMGIANGIQPLLGYNYGSGNYPRFRHIESFTRRILLISGISCTLLYFLLRTQIIRLFISDEKVISYGVAMLIAYMLSGPFIGILFLNMNCLQSTGHASYATILSLLRQGILLIPLLYLLSFTLGLNGVIYGQSFTDYATILLSVFFWSRHGIREKQDAEK